MAGCLVSCLALALHVFSGMKRAAFLSPIIALSIISALGCAGKESKEEGSQTTAPAAAPAAPRPQGGQAQATRGPAWNGSWELQLPPMTLAAFATSRAPASTTPNSASNSGNSGGHKAQPGSQQQAVPGDRTPSSEAYMNRAADAIVHSRWFWAILVVVFFVLLHRIMTHVQRRQT